MHHMYFPEQPMSAYPKEEGDKYGYTALLFPNKFFDPVEGSRLYNERLEEYVLVEESGYDGIMLNEHHQTPTCVDPAGPLLLAALARVTSKARLLILGNPGAKRRQPGRVAEES